METVSFKLSKTIRPFSSLPDFFGSELHISNKFLDSTVHSIRAFSNEIPLFEFDIYHKPFALQTYKFMTVDHDVICDISTYVKPGILRHAYVADAEDRIRVTHKGVLISSDIPLVYGIALSLFLDAY